MIGKAKIKKFYSACAISCAILHKSCAFSRSTYLYARIPTYTGIHTSRDLKESHVTVDRLLFVPKVRQDTKFKLQEDFVTRCNYKYCVIPVLFFFIY